MTAYWSLHSHSRFSAKDALPTPAEMVARAVQLGYPALGLTDHGTPAGAVQLYTAAAKAGIKALPGVELYLTTDHPAKERRSMHLTVAAYTEAGYRNLVRLTTLAHRNFYQKPRVDFADLADLAAHGYTGGLLVATGCRSGPVIRTMMTRGFAQARQITEALATWFPRTYIEVMNHGFEAEGWSDDELCAGLVNLADVTGLPLIVTGDSHYCYDVDRTSHDTLKELVTWAENPEDGTFHGLGYHLVDEHWLASYLEPKVLAAGLASLVDLAEVASVRIPELDTFTMRVPDVTAGGDPDIELDRMVWERFDARFPDTDTEHTERLINEMAVIEASGYAGYLLLVTTITDRMTAEGIWFHTRGSATGSLANFCLGITQADPVLERIRMDRFLSGDRTSMPDIDLDIDHEYRDRVAGWVADMFAVRQVATYATWGLDADEEEQRGSLKQDYWSTWRKKNPGVQLEGDTRIDESDWARLTRLAGMELIKNTGKHAAGFVVADSDALLDTLPMVRIGEGGGLVTAYDKDDVEAFGMPKIDLLGSKTLTAMRIACGYIAPDDPRTFWTSIPRDDKATMKMVAAGVTAGLFQLGGVTQRRAAVELKPKGTAEIIAMQALYRTGVSREFQQLYLARRNGDQKAPPMHADLHAELEDTHGIALYQEQVVGILRTIGMEPATLNKMLKAVKSSGRAGLVKARAAVAEQLPAIRALAVGRGWGESDVEMLAQILTEYGSGYSFGKAHSVLYGLVAYRTAWLAKHEPLAFWTGMLVAYTKAKDTKKRDVELMHTRSAREAGLVIRGPHVNSSGVDYTPNPDDNSIRKGLFSLPYVGRDAAAELIGKAPFTSLRDLGQRVVPGKVTGARDLALGKPIDQIGPSTVVTALATAGALNGLPEGDTGGPAAQTQRYDQQVLGAAAGA